MEQHDNLMSLNLTHVELVDLRSALLSYIENNLQPSEYVPEVRQWLDRVEALHRKVNEVILSR